MPRPLASSSALLLPLIKASSRKPWPRPPQPPTCPDQLRTSLSPGQGSRAGGAAPDSLRDLGHGPKGPKETGSMSFSLAGFHSLVCFGW